MNDKAGPGDVRREKGSRTEYISLHSLSVDFCPIFGYGKKIIVIIIIIMIINTSYTSTCTYSPCRLTGVGLSLWLLFPLWLP